ncbi:MAG: Cell wall-binding protein YocH precursor [Firmicutes bacterium ADurb.Bin356]|nr:MAG: Cell wall-binding protein YocH precursor [Firmicutes bacterium ADurb.Bin356]
METPVKRSTAPTKTHKRLLQGMFILNAKKFKAFFINMFSRAPKHKASPEALPIPSYIALLLFLGVALSAAFLGWALLFSDTSVPVTLVYRGREQKILTKADSVATLLENNAITLSESEDINYELSSALNDNMKLVIKSSFPVAVTSGGKVTLLEMRGGTVGEALLLAGIDYDAEDELTRLPFEDVEPGMRIRHIDIQKKYETVTKPIAFKEQVIRDNSRYKPPYQEAVIKTEGEDGEKLVVRELVYKDGELASREVMNQLILKDAVDRVVLVGTKTKYQTGLTGDEREWRPAPKKEQVRETIQISEITAYTHTGRRTATGRWPKIGYVAVNTNLIPYGTKLYIPGYGYCVAQDTGAFGAHKSDKNQIDVFMNTKRECLKWGRKYNVTVQILK